MSSLLTFIGHWHPVVVHLPIGMILGALLLQALSTRPGFASLGPAVPVVLLMGVLSAMLACLTGWVLSLSGDYDASLVGWHMWMGISLTFVSFCVWVRVRQPRAGSWRWAPVDWGLALLVLALVVVTGHLGGSLTHGSDYLTFGGGGSPVAEVDSPIVNVQEARAYAQVVRPLLRDNCYGCHGATRQKGGLRMDDTVALFRGGKDGVVVLPGRGGASELIKRLLLPEEDEHHMPPKQKAPLNSREILLLHWWIDQGADVSKRVAELKQPDSVRGALLAVQGMKVHTVVSDVPVMAVTAADEKAVAALRAKGVLVMPVAQGRNWLEVEFPGGGGGDWLQLVLPVRKQLIALRLDHASVGDAAMAVVGQFSALRSLDLAGDSVGDAGLEALRGLSELKVLNLVGTRVSAAGVAGLKGLPKLRTVYLYKTKVTGGDWVALRKALPKVEIDTGGYSMPRLVTDTAVVRQKK